MGKNSHLLPESGHEEQTSSENAFNSIVILNASFFLTSIHFDSGNSLRFLNA
jgi:hypothetical protein